MVKRLKHTEKSHFLIDFVREKLKENEINLPSWTLWKIKYILLKNFIKCVTYSCLIDNCCYSEMSWFWNVWNVSVILVHAGRVSNLETVIVWRVWERCTQYSVKQVSNCKKKKNISYYKNQWTWFMESYFTRDPSRTYENLNDYSRVIPLWSVIASEKSTVKIAMNYIQSSLLPDKWCLGAK